MPNQVSGSFLATVVPAPIPGKCLIESSLELMRIIRCEEHPPDMPFVLVKHNMFKEVSPNQS